MTKEAKIKKLIQRSKEVIGDCVLENGAIVAANTDKDYYPRQAENYRFVWPRDAAYICVAAQYLKMDIQENFFTWLYEKPEDFQKEKLLFQRYSTNGRRSFKGDQFQPDQAGAMLWAIYSYFMHSSRTKSAAIKKAHKYKDLIERLANGLTMYWDGLRFTRNNTDLWEEAHRLTSVRLENNFTYSLAACARGLDLANELIPNKGWKDNSYQMLLRIDQAYSQKKGYFLRMNGKLKDFNIDASLLGLAYPFNIYDAKDPRMISTVEAMEKNIVTNGGVHRYQFDYYDGEGSGQEGAGMWPLLNAWMSIYWSLNGNKKKAKEYYDWIVDRSEELFYYLPEQFFDDFRIGVYPLAWSHAMFIIASKHLGYIK